MKILWLCNGSPVPINREDLKGGGGWFSSLAKILVDYSEISNITYLFPGAAKTANSLVKISKKEQYGQFKSCGIRNCDKIDKKLILYFKNVLKEVRPDVIQIWGTEYSHAFCMVLACKMIGILDKVVVHIQGLCSVYAEHYFSGIPNNVIHGFTLRDLYLGNLIQQKQAFIRRGENETSVFKTVKHVIGRTVWDYACVTQINPQIHYHYCGELLRDIFYDESMKWSYDSCQKHSIFMSQGSYSIKGLHIAIKSLPLVLQRYPDTKLYISGTDVTHSNNDLKDRLKISRYGKYIKSLLKQYNLENAVIFTGPLNSLEMRQKYLDCNVFIMPSTIENSPNSLGEAMILGVPCIASYVGGVISMVDDGHDGVLFHNEAYYMLAYQICNIFANKDFASQLSENALNSAKKRFNKMDIVNNLLEIYSLIGKA